MGRPSTGRPLVVRSHQPLAREPDRTIGEISFFQAVNNYIPSFTGLAPQMLEDNRVVLRAAFNRLQSRRPVQSPCWICGRQVDKRDALMALLLGHVRFRHTAPGCSRQCEELRIDSEVISDRFYYLECRHYCASHSNHRCCICWAQDASPPAAASRQS